ncbi:MAG TPA: MFS transporter [Thermomicrobiales bacterium]|nr:MFS transporter [Thermomicrobiales bacterium]
MTAAAPPPRSAALDEPATLFTAPFLLTCATGFALFTSFMLMLAILPLHLKEELGGTDAAVGLIIGVFAFAALFPRPFIGREIDRSGSKRFLMAGAVIFVFASLLYLVAGNIPLLMGVRVLHGVGMACFHTAAFSFVAELAPARRRGEAMGIWGLMSTFATAIGPFVGLIIRDSAGTGAVFLVSAACAATGMFLIAFVREPPRAVYDTPRDGGLFEPAVLTPAIMVVLLTLVYGAVSSFVLLYADERDIARKGLYFTAFAAAVLASRVFGGRLADRYGRWAVILPAMTVTACAMLTLAITSSLPLLLLAGMLFGLGFGAGHPAMTALAVDLVRPERRGAGMATFTSAFELGIGSGSIVMGLVAASTGYAAMFAICAVFPAIAVAYGVTRLRAAG